MIKTLCVFASSSNNLEECYYSDAKEIGRLIGMSGMSIVYGGSRLGMMYACAKEVRINGGKVIGVMPERLYSHFGFGNPDDCDEFILTKGMRERKEKMDEISDGVIALAGGFGTLEELSEMITQKQLGYNKKPIVLLNTDNFYSNLTSFFDTIIEKGFAKPNSKELYYIANSPFDAINYIKSYKIENLNYAGKF